MPFVPSYRLVNVDDFAKDLDCDDEEMAATLDICVAALAYKNFEFLNQRYPFVIECRTNDPLLWLQLVKAADRRYWIANAADGVAVFDATEHCGCLRTYRLGQPSDRRVGAVGENWVSVRDEAALCSLLDTPAARGVYKAWHEWATKSTADASEFAEGRNANTSTQRSWIFASASGCIACSNPAAGLVRTSVGLVGDDSVMAQVPLCGDHMRAAKSQPSVLHFLAKLFSLPAPFPELERHDGVPDEYIPMVHEFIANQLEGTPTTAEKRERGWNLKVELPSGWHWHLRINTLEDYAYMLFKPGETKAMWRADSAPDHPDLPFFPDHEHARPNRKSDRLSPSFLYGLPFFDFKRLRDVGREMGAG